MTDAGRKNVAILFGGRSVEHEISILTALQLIEVMDVVRYRPIPVYVAQDGRWYVGNPLLKKDFYKALPDSLATVTEVTLLPKPGTGGLTILHPQSRTLFHWFKSKSVLSVGAQHTAPLQGPSSNVIPVDIFFLAFHGTFGEDGCIQGLLETADVAYTGSGVLSSAIGMNKWVCKNLLRAHGIPVLPAALVNREEARRNLTEARAKILSTPGLNEFPLFVKPCNLGSSIGISPAADPPSLDAALVKIFDYDTQAIVEPQVVELTEVNVSVLDDDVPRVSVVETPVSDSGVLTYEDKYTREGGKKTASMASRGMVSLNRKIDPDDLDPQIKEMARQFAKRAFQILGCSGVARIDFILDRTSGNLYFNEINTLPGSLAFYLWEKSNPPLVYTELLNRIIERAIARKRLKEFPKRTLEFRALFQ